MKTIGVYPKDREESHYYSAMKDVLHSLGYKVVDYDTALKSPETSLINFNFLENIVAKNQIMAFAKYLKRRWILWQCKMRHKRIIFTMHNKIPHNTAYSRYSKAIMIRTIQQAAAIHIFSKASVDILREYTKNENINNKCFYIPHPNYADDYIPKKQLDRRSYAKDDEMIVLFFGQIRRYKNLEILISAADRFRDCKIKFLIAGRPESEEYGRSLLRMIGGNQSIQTEFRFLPDDEIAAWIEISNVVVFPYSQRSSLTSGTVFLAASKGRTCICPNIATMQEMENKAAFFRYEYANDEDHAEQLSRCIERAYQMFLHDPAALEYMGEQAKAEVIKNNSREVLQCQYKKMLDALKL